MSPAPLSLLLVDDHEIVRRGLTDLLEADGDIVVAAQAGTVADALLAAKRADPQVAVLDVRLPDGSGIELCAELKRRHPSLACLMLTSFADDHALIDAAAAGASAYLLKELTGNDIVESVRKVAAGAVLLDNATLVMANRRIHGSDEGRLDELTQQERRVLDLIGDGYANKRIADEMFLAEKTIKNYVTNLLSKLGMQRRTEAAALAARLKEREERRFR